MVLNIASPMSPSSNLKLRSLHSEHNLLAAWVEVSSSIGFFVVEIPAICNRTIRSFNEILWDWTVLFLWIFCSRHCSSLHLKFQVESLRCGGYVICGSLPVLSFSREYLQPFCGTNSKDATDLHHMTIMGGHDSIFLKGKQTGRPQRH